MKAPQRTTVVGVFHDRTAANTAIADLHAAGFGGDQIGVVMKQGEWAGSGTGEAGADDDGSYAGTGAITGILTGLGLGALAGLGVLAGAIPVVGPAIAAGTLGVVLSNAAVGAGIVGIAGALIGAGIPEEEARYYESEFEAGRTIVTVNAGSRADEAMAIMRRHGAYDMSTRDSAVAETCSTTPSAAQAVKTAKTAPAPTTSRAARAEGDTIQVKEERLHVEKRPVEAGEVRVRKDVHTETKTIEVPVQHEEVVIERTPVHGRAATEGISTTNLKEGEEIRVPVRGEQVDVTKQAVVTEEVKVGKRVVQDTEKVSGQVRKEEIHVDQKGDVDIQGSKNKPRR